MIVIDANVFLAAVLNDETHDASREFYQTILSGTTNVIAPCIFRYEVANAFCMALRRKRLMQPIYDRFIMLISTFPIVVDHEQKMEEVSKLACFHGLTMYDAAYIETAKRRKIPLATLDKAMLRSARKEDISLLL